MSQHQFEIAAGERFAFGANWQRFLTTLDEAKIQAATKAFCSLLQTNDLQGKCFLDVGSGSGLSSLVARRLGASVVSFDYDKQSVECTRTLKRNYFPDDDQWTVIQGSALDVEFLQSLGQFDIVYSWGVLHHTGDMWQALGNIVMNMKRGGQLAVAIYNDQGWISRYWKAIKRAYCRSKLLRTMIILWHFPYPFAAPFLLRLLTGRLKLDRGMSYWHDYLDWLGGYPFEVATPAEISEFYRNKGLELIHSKLTHRQGCSEFLFSDKGR